MQTRSCWPLGWPKAWLKGEAQKPMAVSRGPWADHLTIQLELATVGLCLSCTLTGWQAGRQVPSRIMNSVRDMPRVILVMRGSSSSSRSSCCSCFCHKLLEIYATRPPPLAVRTRSPPMDTNTYHKSPAVLTPFRANNEKLYAAVAGS